MKTYWRINRFALVLRAFIVILILITIFSAAKIASGDDSFEWGGLGIFNVLVSIVLALLIAIAEFFAPPFIYKMGMVNGNIVIEMDETIEDAWFVSAVEEDVQTILVAPIKCCEVGIRTFTLMDAHGQEKKICYNYQVVRDLQSWGVQGIPF